MGCPPPARSITLRRTWASSHPSSPTAPSPSGPRCARRAAMRRAVSAPPPGPAPARTMPAIPHTALPEPHLAERVLEALVPRVLGAGARQARRPDPLALRVVGEVVARLLDELVAALE